MTSGITLDVQLKVMEQLEFVLVRNCKDSELQFCTTFIQGMLYVWGHPIRTLIQNGDARPMVEQSRKCNALLLAWGEIFLPITYVSECRPHNFILVELKLSPAIDYDLRGYICPLETNVDILICSAKSFHLPMRLRVNHQVAKRPLGDKIHLRQEVYFTFRWHCNRPFHERPQPAHHPEKAGLATTILSRDKHALPLLDRKIEVLDQQGAIGLVDRNVIEFQGAALMISGRVGALLGPLSLNGQYWRLPLQVGHE